VLSIREGRLFVEELEATELVERFGSPIFVFSENQLRSNLRRIRSAFEAGWRTAGRHPARVQGQHDARDPPHPERGGRRRGHLLARGARGVLRTGVDPELVSVNGGGKSREHLRRCVEAGVRITVEDVHEIDIIQDVAAELGSVAKIRFRVKSIVPNLWRRTDFSQASVPIDLGIQVYKSGIHRSTWSRWQTRVRHAERRTGRPAHARGPAPPEHVVPQGPHDAVRPGRG